jgi:hypothetical protein
MKKSKFQDKRDIQRRILRLATELWEIKDKNVQSIDPIVTFLIGAISEELAKLGTEISEIRHGLVDEISSSLLPKELIGAKPAHAVIHAMPNDTYTSVDRRHQFITKVDVPLSTTSTDSEEREIYFSPVADFNLMSARVEKIITPGGLLEWQNTHFDVSEHTRLVSEHGTILLGISLDSEIEHIHNLNLFFYTEDGSKLTSIIDEISVIQATIGNHPVEFSRKSSRYLSNENAIRSFITISHMQEQEVLNFYNPFNAEIKLNLNVRNWREKSSLFIQNQYLEDADEFGLQDLLWIQLKSSNPESTELLNDLRCQTNCFPVINRRFREFSYRTNGYYNILNLPGNDEFYDIEEVYSISGKHYQSTNLNQTSAQEGQGFYEIRSHRTGRIDENEVVNKLNYLIDLLRDESSAFSALDYSFLNIHLRTLNQNIELLRNKIPKSHTPTTNTYLILNTKDELDTVFIKFWTTEGELGNRVDTGNTLLAIGNHDLATTSIALVCKPSMGRNQLSAVERLRKLQWQLTSKDTVYSREDIRKFCLAKSLSIANVEIKYKMKVHPEAKSGFEKVIAIDLIPSAKHPMSNSDKEKTRIEIEKGIEYKSLLTFPTEVTWRQ